LFAWLALFAALAFRAARMARIARTSDPYFRSASTN